MSTYDTSDFQLVHGRCLMSMQCQIQKMIQPMLLLLVLLSTTECYQTYYSLNIPRRTITPFRLGTRQNEFLRSHHNAYNTLAAASDRGHNFSDLVQLAATSSMSRNAIRHHVQKVGVKVWGKVKAITQWTHKKTTSFTPFSNIPKLRKLIAIALCMWIRPKSILAMTPSSGPKTPVLPMKREQLISAISLWFILFIALALLHAAEIAITTLYPWKVKEFAEEEQKLNAGSNKKGTFAILNEDITRVLTTILVSSTAASIYGSSFLLNLFFKNLAF